MAAGPCEKALNKRRAATSEALREAYREAKRNFIDVAELRAALDAMGKGKTGRTCHRRSFRRRLRGCPWPVPRLFDPTLPTASGLQLRGWR